MSLRVFGGIDLGGTSVRCVLGTGPDAIMAEHCVPTTRPQETLDQVVQFFTSGPGQAAEAIGVACFGPVAVDPGHPNYGSILATSKSGWSDTDVLRPIKQATGKPVGIESDVIAAALAERRWGAGQGEDNLAYITVGTGIGAGIITNGVPLHGALHSEVGHIRVPRHPDDHAFLGVCPFHGDCVEGLASAPALADRWGMDPASLPDNHPAWDIEATYLGHLCTTLVLVAAVRRVIIGGGVSARPGLVDLVAAHTDTFLAGYGASLGIGVRTLVRPAGLGLKSGVLGGLIVAERALMAA